MQIKKFWKLYPKPKCEYKIRKTLLAKIDDIPILLIVFKSSYKYPFVKWNEYFWFSILDFSILFISLYLFNNDKLKKKKNMKNNNNVENWRFRIIIPPYTRKT